MTPAELRKLADGCDCDFDASPLEKDAAKALRRAADAIERLETPYCLGRTTIQTVAAEGQLALESGHSFIAASDLYKKDPYSRITELEAENKRLREALEWYAGLTQSVYGVSKPSNIAARARAALAGESE
jgi:hypothetical protein